MTTNEDKKESWVHFLLGALAILAIKSLFEHDNSKIISQRGRKILSDDKKMDEIDEKINSLENKENKHNEIVI